MCKNRTVRLLPFFIFFAGINFAAFSSETVEFSPIVIQKEKRISLYEEILQEEMAIFPFNSLEEVIDYSSGIELRKRNSFGIQQDLSIRGSDFEDNSVYLNGIRINDPQTGHFSLEIPLTEFDLEKVVIKKDSLGVNFLTKAPRDEGFHFKTYWGEHALWGELLSLNFPLKSLKNRISFERRVSSGSRQDTDFKTQTFVFDTLLERPKGSFEVLFASQEKDFGANSFYSSNYPHEEEHTNQRFFQLRSVFKETDFSLTNNVYFRRYRDKFILDRHDPSFYTNYHTTYVYGLNSCFDFHEWLGLGFQLNREKIQSTNLNNHSRINKEINLILKPEEKNRFSFRGEFNFLHSQGYDFNETFSLRLSYLLNDSTQTGISVNRLLRLPSFTELYYSSPANRGNTLLDAEKADNFEVFLARDFTDKLSLNFSLFLRKHRNAIDWVKDDSTAPWQASNIGSLETKGVDAVLNFIFDSSLLNKLALSYTYLDSSKNSFNYSKYVFDYNRHKFVSAFDFIVFGLDAAFLAAFTKTVQRDDSFNCDLKITKKISDNFKLFIEGTNIFDEDYYELTEVKASGRWCKVGVECAF